MKDSLPTLVLSRMLVWTYSVVSSFMCFEGYKSPWKLRWTHHCDWPSSQRTHCPHWDICPHTVCAEI